MINLIPYKKSSNSVKNLKNKLKSYKLPVKITNEYIENALNINWGCTKLNPEKKYINNPLNVLKAIDKKQTFAELTKNNIDTVEYTIDINVAKEWITKKYSVVGRKLIKGSQGKGIIIFPDNPIEECPLYTKYIRYRTEYRVFIFQDKVIDILQKKKKLNTDSNTKIRSHNNGWVFCRKDILIPEDIKELSITAVKALKLDFAAVDIIFNKETNKCCVLEVNTAPGITETSVVSFANAIKSLYLEG